MSLIKEKELPLEKLCRKADVEALGFKTTKGLEKLEGLAGQDRAVRAIKFGLSVPDNGYNIFMVGEPGSGRATYAEEELEKAARSMPAPDDWVYVYNFDDNSVPLAINLPAGKGRELAKDTANVVEDLKVALGKAFDNNDYEEAKAQLVKNFQEIVNKLMEDLRKWAEGKNFMIKRTPQGFVNLPMIMAEPLRDEEADSPEESAEAENTEAQKNSGTELQLREMQQDEFENLTNEEQEELQKTSEEISQKTLITLRLIREREKDLKERIKELESEICRGVIEPVVSELRVKYKKNTKLEKWLDSFSEDVITNFSTFLAVTRDDTAELDFSKYEVNPFVSNDPEKGAPVIKDTNPLYYNLIGKVEYESKQGNLSTDFRKITPGSIHKANGGFLLLEADELLRQFMSWDALKRVLRYGELTIENLGEQLGYIPVSSLRPEPIPIKMKVLIVGTPYLYYLLNIYDPEFQEIFKIKANFDREMRRTPESEMQVARFIAGFVEKKGKLNFTAGAVGEIIEYASRMTEDQNKLCTQFHKINEILTEATAWARADNKRQVGADSVKKAIDEKIYRSDLLEEKIRDEYEDGVIKLDLDGKQVGQINGLTVLQIFDHSFGSPVRITANTYMGQDGVVNIEREVNMTGPIHNKGLLTLSSYLGKKYAQDFPLSISARLAFEQTYGGVEGDSASSTELYALLSSLSEVPLRQDIGVTGSVDQFGNIQPIGGVNEKIEGFFSYCKVLGLTGRQGVMIPYQNERHLMLNSEVLAAVKKGKFHIWSIKTIDEGIELLTGVKAGEQNEKGEYPKNSVHGKILANLEASLERGLRFKKKLQDKVAHKKKNSTKKTDTKKK